MAAIDRHKFLTSWFQDCEGRVEIRILPDGEQGFFSIGDHEGIDAFALKHAKKNIYFGMTSRNGSGGTRDDVIDAPGCWADIDFKNTPQEKVDKLLAECPLPPTFVVKSGHGYHCYWRFREPTDNKEMTERINKQLAQYFESDPVFNAAHILRLPDTFNYKYKPRRAVKVLSYDQTRQYNYSDFEEHLPPLKHTNEAGKVNAPGWQDEALKGAGTGHRHHTAAKLAGRYINKGLSDQEILPIMQQWDRNNTPSIESDYGAGEILKIIESIRKTHDRNNPGDEVIAEGVPENNNFPEVMTSVAGDFAETYSSYLEVPKHFLFMGFLTCLGSILANRLRLASELDTQPRLYTILLGESADDRKSTALIKTVKFFQEAMEYFPVCTGIGSAEGLGMRLKKSSNLLLSLDEFKGFINKSKIEASVLLPMVNSLFEMNSYEAHTKSSSIEVPNAFLSLLAASTVQTWEKIWTPAFTDIGFYNRLWLVPGTGKRKFSLPAKIPQEKKQALRNGLVDILKCVGPAMELDLADEAKELYQAWYMDLEPSIHAKRLDTYTMRLMPLIAINEFKDEVDKETVQKVIALANWQLEVRRLHDPVDAENNVAKLEELIRRALTRGPKSDRDLKRNTNANRVGLWYYGMAIGNLQKANEIIWCKKGRSWRLAC